MHALVYVHVVLSSGKTALVSFYIGIPQGATIALPLCYRCVTVALQWCYSGVAYVAELSVLCQSCICHVCAPEARGVSAGLSPLQQLSG
jgi:hypothetical protein